MTVTTLFPYEIKALHRLIELEHTIGTYQGCECQAHWIEEYLDLGLYCADKSPKAWQANAVQRLFNTLINAIRNPNASSFWRNQCFEYLYQPFFVLQQLYQQSDIQKCYLCNLLRSYNEAQPYSNKLDRIARNF